MVVVGGRKETKAREILRRKLLKKLRCCTLWAFDWLSFEGTCVKYSTFQGCIFVNHNNRLCGGGDRLAH